MIGSAAILGGGASLVMASIQKKFSGESMTLKETTKDVALGSTIGALTGPIGSTSSS